MTPRGGRPAATARTRSVASATLASIGAGSGDDAAAAFAAQATRDIAADELQDMSAADIAANIADFWRNSDRRRGRAPQIRIAPAIGDAPYDRLEIVQDDAPFLVDSIMGEIADQGLTVRALLHPVVTIRRDRAGARSATGMLRRESLIQVILDRVGADREGALLAGVKATLADVRAAVDDFQAMLDLMSATVSDLKAAPGRDAERDEEIAFLTWLEAERFVFLGARTYVYPRLPNGELAPEEPLYQAVDGLGVLRDAQRTVLRRANEPAVLTAQVKDRLATDPALTVAKSNVMTRVHRRGHMDYIGVKRYGLDGTPVGEVRFVGLFTADAYDEPADAVPLIRAKVAHVLERAAMTPGSHNDRRLRNIIENYPRDELFQATEAVLTTQMLGIAHLYDRPRVKLFERRDPLDRFASILLFVPRDRYDSVVRVRSGELLARAYGGRLSAYYPSFPDGPLARVHFIIGFTPGDHLKPNLRDLEAAIVEIARTWEDRFEAAVRISGRDPAAVAAALTRYAGAFAAGYRERYDAEEALADVATVESLAPDELARARAFRLAADPATRFRFKFYRPDLPATLADILPILDNMGLKAIAEFGHPIRPVDGRTVWVHEFEIEDERGEHLVFAEVKAAFEAAVVAVWTGQTENDGFNRLVLELSIPWREAALVRALARYRRQSGLDPTQQAQEEALAGHPGVTRLILDLFRTKFHPAIRASLSAREAQAAAVADEIVEALQHVASLDDDRVLRRLALLVGAIKRTNFYQRDPDGALKPYISFKVASGELADLPAPKPYREIFVWATHVEGVHLRFGPVARGGLRWSDRRDDFRTEVLGLAKAQQVKNAVIVPVGSKGGFYPKMLPKTGAPDLVRAEAIRAYTTFLNGLLDITDNLTPDGKVIHPDDVVIYDPDDPYLVVAADKGTATFSDIANGVAESYGFWLGDAFASGGSAGYDHKAMGITARGAWEAVKRHFRELGKDIQAEPFTVVGVGDMSGDVFGNGMLLSRQTRLLAAFDHRHVFFDPDPDVARSYGERARLFALPRSSWDDYDRKAISTGGGVFSRSLKSIPLSPEVRAMLGVTTEAMAPAEVLHAILQAEAELLYLGGVGTYVKSGAETHADVGDKANDAVRVNGADLRVKVVGEGANLGFTQAGRIEFALAGGRIDTDAIDNSGGVDSSDHEVNIKILTGALERTGQLTRRRRDRLLHSMTDELAQHVLEHNYDQTLALSLLEMDAPAELDAQSRFMAELEKHGRLDRVVEGLPDAAAIGERAKSGRGLTRPELAVLLAYGKLELSRDIVESEAPDDPYFERVFLEYFPKPLRKYRATADRHRLRREIIAMMVANDVVNRCGPTFPCRLMAAAACDATAFAAGYEAAKAVLDLPTLWDATAALDGEVAAAGQMPLFSQIAAALRGLTFWLARRAARDGLSVEALIQRYGPGLKALRKLTPRILSPGEQATYQARVDQLTTAGAPVGLSQDVAALPPLTTAADLVDLAEASSWPIEKVAQLYHQVGSAFAFDRLRAAAGAYSASDSFERTALRRLLEDLLGEQAVLTRALMSFAASPQAGDSVEAAAAAIASWSALRRDVVVSARDAVAEIEAADGGWSFAKLTLANAAVRELSLSAARRGRR